MLLGRQVHYICTESHKCQAAFVSAINDDPNPNGLVTLHVLRPADQADNPDQAPVERLKNIPYASATERKPGTWHYENTHTGMGESV